jgi:hypothetical protein
MHRDKTPNRLVNEKSPYLLQHAWNPVEWYPWGEEAFEKSRRDDLPIFLSVGYSTCHWCHVMERESFEDAETAAYLNSHFVPVKVDREEHPDLDRLYMLFVQATTGSGGWPMSVWLTPTLKPFYGGSYFPPVERWGRPSFRTVLETLAGLWDNDREKVVDSAGSMMRHLIELALPPTPNSGEMNLAPAGKCLTALERSFDPQYGGFGGAPKFPRPPIFRFLFSHAKRTGNRKALDMALFTLRKMAEGGIHDQLGVTGRGGGGFARYSTDERWHVPHFEKMLYDNAQLAASYLEAWQATRDPIFADTARDIFNYVLMEMRSPEGAFWSAEDADSLLAGSEEGREGAFYLWTKQEVMALLGPETGKLFCDAFLIREEGNAPMDPHGEFTKQNILIRDRTTAQVAQRFSLPPETVELRLEEAKEKLFATRSLRPRPHLDDKVLTSWNGLMISALAKGYRVLQEKPLLDAAKRATSFILETLYDRSSGRLLRRYRDGDASIPGNAGDYACMVQALLDLYEASFDPAFIETALRLTDTQIEHFYDQVNGGFFSTANDDRSVPLRLKEDNDGAEPSANSVTVMNLFRLAAMTGREEPREAAEKSLHCFSGTLNENPLALPLMLVALDVALSPTVQIVLAGSLDDPQMAPLCEAAARHNRPDAVTMHANETQSALLPEAAAIGRMHKGPPAAYLCIGGSCQPPVTDPETLAAMLSASGR